MNHKNRRKDHQLSVMSKCRLETMQTKQIMQTVQIVQTMQTLQTMLTLQFFCLLFLTLICI